MHRSHGRFSQHLAFLVVQRKHAFFVLFRILVALLLGFSLIPGFSSALLSCIPISKVMICDHKNDDYMNVMICDHKNDDYMKGFLKVRNLHRLAANGNVYPRRRARDRQVRVTETVEFYIGFKHSKCLFLSGKQGGWRFRWGPPSVFRCRSLFFHVPADSGRLGDAATGTCRD
jgi:hypothetical protein